MAEGSIATGKPSYGASILYDIANARFGDGSAVCEQGRRVRVALRLKRSALTDPGGGKCICAYQQIIQRHSLSATLCMHLPLMHLPGEGEGRATRDPTHSTNLTLK